MLILVLLFLVTYPYLSGLYAEIVAHIQDGIEGG